MTADGPAPEGLAALARSLGLVLDRVLDDGFGGKVTVFVDSESPLARAEVVMTTWEGETTFRYVPGDDVELALAEGRPEAEVARLVEDVRAKAAAMRAAAGAGRERST